MSDLPLGQSYADILWRCKRSVSLEFITDPRLSVFVSLIKLGRPLVFSAPVQSALNGYVLCWPSDHPRGAMRFCFFRATGRPCSIFGLPTDTETESEQESATQRDADALLKVIEISPIPSPRTSPDSNVQLESISLVPAQPPLLRGTVRVRNIAYEKLVTVRFTTDGWETTVEAQAHYNGNSPSDGTWDRFAFTIPLEWHAGLAGPTPRTLLLAVRYAVLGIGEWWNNNGGDDFRIVLDPTKSISSWLSSTIMSDARFVTAAAFPRRNGCWSFRTVTTRTRQLP
jgi:hypothetical protein